MVVLPCSTARFWPIATFQKFRFFYQKCKSIKYKYNSTQNYSWIHFSRAVEQCDYWDYVKYYFTFRILESQNERSQSKVPFLLKNYLTFLVFYFVTIQENFWLHNWYLFFFSIFLTRRSFLQTLRVEFQPKIELDTLRRNWQKLWNSRLLWSF